MFRILRWVMKGLPTATREIGSIDRDMTSSCPISSIWISAGVLWKRLPVQTPAEPTLRFFK